MDCETADRDLEKVPTRGEGVLRDGPKRRVNYWKGAIRESPRGDDDELGVLLER